nr:tRNA pseudouridine(38-40) synthase TruA [Galactobacter caseinivorans]
MSSEPAPTRFALTLAYDGGPFHGWARQSQLGSVQQSLEEALELILRMPTRTVVAGRTDTGVHARGQVVHLDITEQALSRLVTRDGGLDAEATLVRRLNSILNASTSGAVLVREARVVPPGFDARFSALWRSYTYTIADGMDRWDPLRRGDTLFHPRELDVEAMQQEAAALVGLHDFLSYCKPRQGATTIRELQELLVQRHEEDGLIRVHLRADAFCHHMVRSIVGALISVGEAKREPGWAHARLQERVRDAKTTMVAGHALVLEAVGYPEDHTAGERAQATRVRRKVQ